MKRTDAEEIARSLPTFEAAEQWLALLAPAVHLEVAAADDPVAARLGGQPMLPSDVEWPLCLHVPLIYVGELLCEGLIGFDTGLALPAGGRFVFFYTDPSTYFAYESYEPLESWVAYYADDVELSPRPVPEGARRLGELALTPQQIVTEPPGAWWTIGLTVEQSDSFAMLQVGRGRSGIQHQVGGYLRSIQGAYDDYFLEDGGLDRWKCLIKFDTDTRIDLMYGDSGVLTWWGDNQALAAGEVAELRFIAESG